MSAIDSSPPDWAAVPELDLTDNALTVLQERYLARDDAGQIVETPQQLYQRVAQTIAHVEARWGASTEEVAQRAGAFYRLMASRRFLPNSPTLMNAGRRLGMLSACFVLPLDDSIEEIMETARQIALVQRAGGGTGIDLSRLRPKGSIVRSSGGTTDGPISFLKMFSSVTEAIQQGAFRRGANMGVLRVDHPDICTFIELKSDLTQVTNYNLSVAVTDEFMQALEQDPQQPHAVVNPFTGQIGHLRRDTGSADYSKDTQASAAVYFTVEDIWSLLVERAWYSGDPGLIFIEEVNRHHPTPQLGPVCATNPCGEQPLLPYEACNLGSINLAAFFVNAEPSSTDPIDWHALRETTELAVRFLDNVIETNRYPTPEIHDATHRTRKIGLGVMGWADLLFALRIPYDSEDALQWAERLGSFIRDAAWVASEQLAEARGTFPSWQGSIWDTQHNGLAMRNAQVTTIAPTGTISILAGCSSGIEPVFSLAFDRQVLGGKTLREVNSIFAAATDSLLSKPAEISAVLDHAARHGSIQALTHLPQEMRDVFRTARDIGPQWHVRMQAAWQQHTDAAVSKTINLPSEASTTDVDLAFRLAHSLKCKGITVYRDGSRALQPMALKQGPEVLSHSAVPAPARPKRLPEVIPSVRLRQPTPFGNMHLHISVDPETGVEREVFAQLGKGGDLANSDLEAICRLVSLLLRLDGDIGMVVDQLAGIGSSLTVPSRSGRIRSLGDGLARALAGYSVVKQRCGLEAILAGQVTTLEVAGDGADQTDPAGQEALFKIKCPECAASGALAFEEGCLKCHACGYSIC